MDKLNLQATGADLYKKGLLAEHFVVAKDKINELVDFATAIEENGLPGDGSQTPPPVAFTEAEALSRRAGGVLNRPLLLGTFGGYNNGFSDGGEQSRTYSFEPNTPIAGSGIQLVFGNFSIGNSYGGGSVAPGAVVGLNDITVKAGIYNGDAFYNFTFNGGEPSAKIKPGMMAITDPLPWFLKAGGGSNLHTSVAVDTMGQKWPRGITSRNSASGEVVGGSVNGGGAPSYHPIAVMGDLVTPRVYGSVALVGDSIYVGGGTGTEPADLGYAARALNAAGIPFVRMATYGAVLDSYTAYNRTSAALNAIGGVEHVVCELGVNNMLELLGQGLPAMQARYVALWKRFAALGAKVHQCTITPFNGDSSAQFIALRGQLNDWIRTVPAPLTSCFDVTALAETSLNSNVWKQDFAPDGLHPSATGAAVLAAAITPSTFVV